MAKPNSGLGLDPFFLDLFGVPLGEHWHNIREMGLHGYVTKGWDYMGMFTEVGGLGAPTSNPPKKWGSGDQ